MRVIMPVPETAKFMTLKQVSFLRVFFLKTTRSAA